MIAEYLIDGIITVNIIKGFRLTHIIQETKCLVSNFKNKSLPSLQKGLANMTHVGHKYKGEKFDTKYVNTMKTLTVLPMKQTAKLGAQVNERFQNGGSIMLSTHEFNDLISAVQVHEYAGYGYNDNIYVLRVTNLATNIVLACGVFEDTHNVPGGAVLPEWMLEYMGYKSGKGPAKTQPTIQIMLLSRLEPIKELTLKPDTARYFFQNKSQEYIKQMITEKLENHVALVQGQWLCFTDKDETYWFQVVQCKPAICKVKLEYGITINTTFEKADDLEQWEGKGSLLQAQKRLLDDDYVQAYHQLMALATNPVNVKNTKARIQQIMDDTMKFKENVSQKDNRSLFHAVKKENEKDDPNKMFTGKAYGV